MKKLIALLMALAMVMSLAACGSTDSAASDTDAAPAAEETTAAAEETEAAEEPAEEEAAEEEAAEDEAEEVEEAEEETTEVSWDLSNSTPVVLTVSCGFSDSEQGAQTLTWVMDRIEELSEGNITFDRYMGGSISTPLEDGSNIATGATDFGSMLEATLAEQLTCWQYIGNCLSDEDGIAQINYILHENEETAQILNDEAEAAGLKIFACQVTGRNSVVTRTPIASFFDLEGMTMGCEIGGDTWKNLYGASVQTIAVTDEYESLSRGVVDSTSAALTGVASNKWVEVAPYVLVSPATKMSFWIAMNIDTWNSLDAEQQALIESVANEVTAYSSEYCAEYEESAIAEMEAAGATIAYLSDEDALWNLGAQFYSDYGTYHAIAEAQGKVEQFETVANAMIEYLGFGSYEDLCATYEG